MDSQGFVFLSILTNFNRIKTLTVDVQLVRMVCAYAPSIEFRTGVDGIDRVRRSEDWERWVLKPEERDASVRNEVPIEFQPPQMPQYDMSTAPYSYGQTVGPWVDPAMQHAGWARNGEINDHVMDGTVPPFQPAASRGRFFGKPEKPTSADPTTSTPLSAAVPEFSPSIALPIHDSNHLVDPLSSFENVFSDEQVQSLIIVVEEKRLSTTPPRGPPFANASSRTFSNGSIDGRTLFDPLSSVVEDSPGNPLKASNTNGENASDG